MVEDSVHVAFVELVVDAAVVDFVAKTVGWWKLDAVDLVVSFLALVLVLVESLGGQKLLVVFPWWIERMVFVWMVVVVLLWEWEQCQTCQSLQQWLLMMMSLLLFSLVREVVPCLFLFFVLLTFLCSLFVAASLLSCLLLVSVSTGQSPFLQMPQNFHPSPRTSWIPTLLPIFACVVATLLSPFASSSVAPPASWW